MDEIIKINKDIYTYGTGYKDDFELRESLNKLTEKTFGFNFEKWYLDGYWGDRYIPYSLLYEDRVVSNVSVNILDFDILGNKKRFVQIGTVMTDNEFQNKGLSRVLMEKVLEEWDGKCDLIYLFGNDSVLDFYPKFGFEKCNEYVYSIRKSNIHISTKSTSYKHIRELDMDNIEDRDTLHNLASNTKIFSKVSMIDNPGLIMFYCTNFIKDNIYYLEDSNTVVICDLKGDTLYLNEILSTEDVNLDNVVSKIVKIYNKVENIVLGFTPKDSSKYERSLLFEEDTTLFIRGDIYNLFKDDHLMFPVLSHA